jgi:hypothetical protein
MAAPHNLRPFYPVINLIEVYSSGYLAEFVDRDLMIFVNFL